MWVVHSVLGRGVPRFVAVQACPEVVERGRLSVVSFTMAGGWGDFWVESVAAFVADIVGTKRRALYLGVRCFCSSAVGCRGGVLVCGDGELFGHLVLFCFGEQVPFVVGNAVRLGGGHGVEFGRVLGRGDCGCLYW